MSTTVIRVENIGKLYKLGSIGTGTLTHDLNRWIARIRGKEDPTLKLGQSNDRTKKGSGDFVWALKDINFDVKQGEVLGIIGKNGAGKSTLLKVLSRTTSPTTGSFKAKGRIASLLEVGTGFHPELSGRENVFLNGAILGMTKQEIRSKFDEIVAFSGVERYIDTPVKRYSSGMYVRLAFAVAAHLEPEILIVDEVLAVGDQEFQDKCIGKMKDVSKSGRTVLFVSHNMSAVRNLCGTGILLEKGTLTFSGTANEAVNKYLSDNEKNASEGIIADNASFVNTGEAKFKTVYIKNKNGKKVSDVNYCSSIIVETTFEMLKTLKDVFIDVRVVSIDGVILTHSMNKYSDRSLFPLEQGMYRSEVALTNNFQPGTYTVTIGIFHENGYYMDYVENIAKFKVLKVGDEGELGYTFQWVEGHLHDNAKWKIEKL